MRRLRRPDAGYTDRDAQLWRRLTKQVRIAQHAPHADSTPLHKAARAACKAVPPTGFAIRDSVFLALILGAQAFGHPDREGKAAALAELAARADAILDREAAPPPRRPRSDIDG